MNTYETSLNLLPVDDFRFIRDRWSVFGETAFLTKSGRKWTVREVRGAFRASPLFKTKGEAGRYVNDLILAACRWDAAKAEGRS